MTQDHALTCYIDLPGGRRVEVGLTVYAEPLLPTPNEPDVVRPPALHEWAEICGKLSIMQVTISSPKN